ncbi:hypothetical protein LTR56_014467 [Elasticomyces elasticus]|nr:hypothetical protein LTR56_014467 [Elasticomyces elasticus]KAK3646525.1 hypothetical protein LTR22_014288 [Elasticomyces elasticus]KAK4910448.1 hypothetical protein LTR49_020883 [Elasticomyces elasticus]KAK5755664.1 hypothetical protein LTS12_014225 [Elasticomyces elasticus]
MASPTDTAAGMSVREQLDRFGFNQLQQHRDMLARNVTTTQKQLDVLEASRQKKSEKLDNLLQATRADPALAEWASAYQAHASTIKPVLEAWIEQLTNNEAFFNSPAYKKALQAQYGTPALRLPNLKTAIAKTGDIGGILADAEESLMTVVRHLKSQGIDPTPPKTESRSSAAPSSQNGGTPTPKRLAASLHNTPAPPVISSLHTAQTIQPPAPKETKKELTPEPPVKQESIPESPTDKVTGAGLTLPSAPPSFTPVNLVSGSTTAASAGNTPLKKRKKVDAAEPDDDGSQEGSGSKTKHLKTQHAEQFLSPVTMSKRRAIVTPEEADGAPVPPKSEEKTTKKAAPKKAKTKLIADGAAAGTKAKPATAKATPTKETDAAKKEKGGASNRAPRSAAQQAEITKKTQETKARNLAAKASAPAEDAVDD